LQDWKAAADVLNGFRQTYPGHELQKEATKQIAFVYRQAGELAQSAGEYERVANESTDPALRAEALLLAGNLYEQSQSMDRALDAYSRYVEQFRKPIEAAWQRAPRSRKYRRAARRRALSKRAHEIVRIDAPPRASERGGPQPRRALGAGSHRAAL
jgi:tetratricopeptide (TPR) repeat protein